MSSSIKEQLDKELKEKKNKQFKLNEHSKRQMEKFNSNIFPIKIAIIIQELFYLMFFLLKKLLELIFQKITICPIALSVGCFKCPIYKHCPAKTILGNEKKED